MMAVYGSLEFYLAKARCTIEHSYLDRLARGVRRQSHGEWFERFEMDSKEREKKEMMGGGVKAKVRPR